MRHIVSFSGGKDSTAMLLMMIERGVQIDEIINVDTTKEFPGMYKHIEQVKEYIKPLKITTVTMNFDYWFSEHIRTRGKYKGHKGYGFPSHKGRWCTGLKRQLFREVAYNGIYDAIEYHGIAYNEQHRQELKNRGKTTIVRPLIEWKMTEQNNLKYCYAKGFDWQGLYEKFHRVSCWCCPLSRIGELRTLYRDYPELWTKLKIMEKKSPRKFSRDYSVQELEDRFSKEIN